MGPGWDRSRNGLPASSPVLQLQNDVTIRIYQRTRDWTLEEFQSLSQTLQDYYPNYAGLYALPAWVTG